MSFWFNTTPQLFLKMCQSASAVEAYTRQKEAQLKASPASTTVLYGIFTIALK